MAVNTAGLGYPHPVPTSSSPVQGKWTGGGGEGLSLYTWGYNEPHFTHVGE